MLPHSAEVRLLRDKALVFMGINHVLLWDELWNKLASGLPLLLELLTTLSSSGVNAENKLVLLISLCEGMKSLLGLIEVTAISEPGRLRDLVVEEARWVTLAPLLKSEPVENVWLQSLTSELHGSPLTVHVVHCVIPSLSRVGIKFPFMILLSGGPVRNSETLEKSSRLSIESNFSHSLKKTIGVEVLSKNVMLNVRLLMEFIHIEILNPNTYIILN
jgi:hypothetical protein